MERKLKSTLVCVLLVCMMFTFLGCGKNYVGTWYNINYPNNHELTITEDDTFKVGGIGGSVGVTENGLILSASSGGYGTEILTFDKFDGDLCLIDEEGEIYIQNYNKAMEYYDTH